MPHNHVDNHIDGNKVLEHNDFTYNNHKNHQDHNHDGDNRHSHNYSHNHYDNNQYINEMGSSAVDG